MDFARIWEQAKELWTKPYGKLLLAGVPLFLITVSVIGFLMSRPDYRTLGTFDSADASRVVQRLSESGIPYQQSGNGYTILVPEADFNTAKLLLAELDLDPSATVWSAPSWADKVSWTNTEFDKRQLWKEQTEENLARSIRTLSAVQHARVQISIPMEQRLFREDEQPPKANVVVQPAQGQELSLPVVEAIMEMVAASVEGLDPSAVVVVDASTSRVVSAEAFRKGRDESGGQAAVDQFEILQQVQEHWQTVLRRELERVVGLGNASVIVNPTINWNRVVEEALEYSGAGDDGKGIVLSEEVVRSSSEGTQPGNGQVPAGTTTNADVGIPTYPGANPDQGTFSEEESRAIYNYLVNQTKRITESPGGGIEEIAVGIFVNQEQVDPATEQALTDVVQTALGSKAQVEVAAMPFAPSIFDEEPVTPPPAPEQGIPNWAVMALVAALTLAGVGFFFLALRPRRPVLEPVLTGPESVLMGGIPVSDLEMSTAAEAYGAQAAGREQGERVVPDPDEEAAPLAPEEIALLGDEFLQQLGIDPSKVRMKDRIEKLARSNPEAVASLIRTWMSEG